MRPLQEGEAWKLTKEIDMGGENRARNYVAKGKVKIEGYFGRLRPLKKKSMVEGRKLKIAITMKRRLLKTERTWGTIC